MSTGAESTSQVEDTSLGHYLPDIDQKMHNRGRDEGRHGGSNHRNEEGAPAAASKQIISGQLYGRARAAPRLDVLLEEHQKLSEEKESICAELVHEKRMNWHLKSQMEEQKRKMVSLFGVEDMDSLARFCTELWSKVDQLERLHSEKAMAQSGSYHDSGATPPLLQTAADAVNEAICVCASHFFSSLKKKANHDLYLAQLDIPFVQRSPSALIKASLQALLCKVLFKGFGDQFFSLEGTSIPPFSTPSDKKSDLFLSYKQCRDKEPEHLLKEHKDFADFVHAKDHDLCTEINSQLLSAGDEIHPKMPNWTNDKDSYGRYLRLAKAVWVLHKLALAFEPSAEIFHVGSCSAFNGMFMEDIAHDEDEDGSDKMMEMKPHKQVKFMSVPGFIVRRTVIKSRVFCLPEYIQHVIEKSDPFA
ncbi:hypothetical protein L7F22_002426 [Adiantum nelumboides]|nr:hypothetical protein [Adiantum nelumboides]